MQVTVLGVSPAIPNRGGACAGYILHTDSTKLLVDCGHGVIGRLQEQLDVAELDCVIISHMHPDHYFDLVPLTYIFLFRRLPPVPLWLPPGGKQCLLNLQSAIGVEHGFFEDSFELKEYEPAGSMVIGDLYVTLAPTQHYITAHAMRFSSPGSGVIAYSSDSGPAASLDSIFHEASLGIIEATLLEQQGPEQPGHLTAAEAGDLARRAEVGRVILTHYWEPLASKLRGAASETFAGSVELAQEGRTYSA